MAFKNKSVELQRVLNNISSNMYGRTISESIDKQICVCCGNLATKFDDELSEKEYNINGLCQKCQNDVYLGGN